MPEVEQLVATDGPVATPYTYPVPPKAALEPAVVNATFDGSAAAGAFLPCCSIYSQDGKLISRTFPGTVAAGDVAEVTYGPFLRAPSAAAGIPAPAGEGFAYYVSGSYSALIQATSGLVAYWRMNVPGTLVQPDTSGVGVAANLVPAGGAGTVFSPTSPLVNDATAGSFEFQTANPVVGADSTGAYWTAPGAAKLVLNPWTYECFISPEAIGGVYGAGSQTPLGWAPLFYAFTPPLSGGPNGWFLALDLVSDGVHDDYLMLVLGGQSQQAAQTFPTAFFVATAKLVTAPWYHVALTSSGGVARLYLNGVYLGTCTLPSPTAIIKSIGGGLFTNQAQSANFIRTFIGKISEVAVYNRALSATELLQHALTLGASQLVTEQTIDGSWIGPGTIGTDQLADKSVTTGKIADLAVTAAKIGTNVVTGGGAGNLALLTITFQNIADGTLSTAKYADGSVTTVKLADGKRLLGKATPAYSAAITPDASQGGWQTITVANAVAFTVNAPSNPPAATSSQELTIEILNSSGGAMGAITWNAAFVLIGGAFVNPANTKRRYVTFRWNGTAWIEQNRAGADY